MTDSPQQRATELAQAEIEGKWALTAWTSVASLLTEPADALDAVEADYLALCMDTDHDAWAALKARATAAEELILRLDWANIHTHYGLTDCADCALVESMGYLEATATPSVEPEDNAI